MSASGKCLTLLEISGACIIRYCWCVVCSESPTAGRQLYCVEVGLLRGESVMVLFEESKHQHKTNGSIPRRVTPRGIDPNALNVEGGRCPKLLNLAQLALHIFSG